MLHDRPESHDRREGNGCAERDVRCRVEPAQARDRSRNLIEVKVVFRGVSAVRMIVAVIRVCRRVRVFVPVERRMSRVRRSMTVRIVAVVMRVDDRRRRQHEAEDGEQRE